MGRHHLLPAGAPSVGRADISTGCPRADQWCGRDPAQPDVGFSGQHCQTITADRPCLQSESAVDPDDASQPQAPIPCPDWAPPEPEPELEPARPRASAAAAVAPSTAFAFAAAVVTLATVGFLLVLG